MVQNPLVHLRLAQELRKLNRLEESLESYKLAVKLAPDMLGWRLALARARFDVLDYDVAESDVRYVLQNVLPGSPLELPARNLLAQVNGNSIDRGRRFDPVLTKEMTGAQRKEWASIRAEAWQLFSTGRYQEAEPIYQRMLALNPNDALANYQLGLTLMQLGRCKEALTVFGKMSNLDPNDEDYADTVFRISAARSRVVRLRRASGRSLRESFRHRAYSAILRMSCSRPRNANDDVRAVTLKIRDVSQTG